MTRRRPSRTSRSCLLSSSFLSCAAGSTRLEVLRAELRAPASMVSSRAAEEVSYLTGGEEVLRRVTCIKDVGDPRYGLHGGEQYIWRVKGSYYGNGGCVTMAIRQGMWGVGRWRGGENSSALLERMTLSNQQRPNYAWKKVIPMGRAAPLEEALLREEVNHLQ